MSCERISSQWPLTTGAWLHRLAATTGFASGASAAVATMRAERSTTSLEQAARVALTAGVLGTR